MKKFRKRLYANRKLVRENPEGKIALLHQGRIFLGFFPAFPEINILEDNNIFLDQLFVLCQCPRQFSIRLKGKR